MTQEALADSAGLHAVMVSRVERGVADARVSTLLKIARGLGVEPRRLLDDVS